MLVRYFKQRKGGGLHSIIWGDSVYSFLMNTKTLSEVSSLSRYRVTDFNDMRDVYILSFIFDKELGVAHCARFNPDGSMHSESVKDSGSAEELFNKSLSLRGFIFVGEIHITDDIKQHLVVVGV